MTNELYRIKIDYIVVGFLNFLIIQLKQNQVNLDLFYLSHFNVTCTLNRIKSRILCTTCKVRMSWRAGDN